MKPLVFEFINHHRKQRFADPQSFVRRKKGENNNLAGIPISKAVANHPAVVARCEARATAVLDAYAPRFGGNAKCMQLFW